MFCFLNAQLEHHNRLLRHYVISAHETGVITYADVDELIANELRAIDNLTRSLEMLRCID